MQNKRKIKFIKKRFQTFFMLRFSIAVLILTCIFSLFIYYLSKGSTTIVFKDLRLHTIPTHTYLIPSIISGIFISLFITSFASITLALVYSHRISGPMVAFERIIKGIGEGKFNQKVILRKNDEWKETAIVLNSSLSSVSEKMENLESTIKDLQEDLDLNDPKISAHIENIKAQMEEFEY